MAIFFTQGGPQISTAPSKPLICAGVVYDVTIEANAVWVNPCADGSSTDMEDYIASFVFFVPRADYRLILVTVRDRNGDFVDVDGFEEIRFVVADSFGGTVRIDKSLSDGNIMISTNNRQFYFEITEADSMALVNNLNYYECRATASVGKPQTILAGLFRSPETMIAEIV